jgi:hypothetical protein
MKAVRILAVVAAVWATSLSAQTVTDLKVVPTQVKVGEAVQATVNFDVGAVTNCGLHIVWGDGAVLESKINQAQDVPTIASHQYTKPGTYTIVAEPKRVGSVLKCNGKNQKMVVTVAAAAVAAAPVAPAAPAVAAAAPAAASDAPAKAQTSSDLCPKGWTLSKASVKANGSFTCKAAPKTKVPKEEIMCLEKLKYFADSKSGQLGCRP